MKPTIKVQGLGKRYYLGGRKPPYSTLREMIMELARNPLRSSLRNDNDRSIWALKDIDLEVGRGEIIGAIGRNGAGKSTLLKILSRVTEPTVGRVDLYGRVASLLEVGTGFHAGLTGRENVFLNGLILGMTRKQIRSRFDEIVAFSEVEKFIDTPVKYYSSGMYIRLAFAVAAHLESEILLIDEALTVADSTFYKKCLTKMLSVTAQGGTVILVSRDLAALSRLCNRCFVLERGQLINSGPTMDVVQTYVTSSLFGVPDYGRAEQNAVWKDIAFQAAHKLGNPVFALETDLQGIKRNIKEKPDEALNVALEMEVSIEKAKAIIDQFKSFIRAQESSPRPINMIPVLESSARVARANGVTIQIISPERNPWVFFDPARLTECFDEFFANSLHWFNKEEKRIEICVDIPPKKELPPGLNPSSIYVRISFEDNGCGVALSEKEQIFVPFYTTHPNGTGLGLSLAQRVIDWHGGLIRENSELGHGARFEIFLPQSAEKEKGANHGDDPNSRR